MSVEPLLARSVAPASRPRLGIVLKIASVTAFVVSSGFIKLSPSVPLGQQLFIRSMGALLSIVIVLAWRGELKVTMRTHRPYGHLWRSSLGILSLLLTMYGLAHLPLSEVITISYGAPFFIVLFGAMLLGERVGFVRWLAVLVGVAGVLVVMWPRLTMLGWDHADRTTSLATLAMAVSCVTGASAMLALRRLGSTERSATMTLYFFSISALVGLASAALGNWTCPVPAEIAALVAAGLAGSCAQLLLAECYKHADLSTIAPFEYVSIILSIAIGIVVFGEVLEWSLMVGASFVISSGLLVLLYEHKRRIME